MQKFFFISLLIANFCCHSLFCQTTKEQEETELIKKILTAKCGSDLQMTNHSFQGQCLNALSVDWTNFQDPKLYVFISFSMPDQAWISLSKELVKVGGTFVLRGLPNQSFQEFARHILQLKEQGVVAPIQLDPNSFLKFEIGQIPTIVAAEDGIFDKITGHVSLKYALEKMAEHGETKIAKMLYQSLKDKK